MIFDLENRKVVIKGNDYFIADNATIIGSVQMYNDVSIWFNTVIRGDNGNIIIGERSNIQDSCVLHTDEGIELIVGKGVTVGHKAMLHGCEIGNDSLIGINTVILNGAKIGKNCLIGANALITENKVIPDNSVVLGSPGKIIREISKEQREDILNSAEHYRKKYKQYQGINFRDH